MDTLIKHSSLHAVAARAGAAFTELAGWQLPERFSTIESEIAAARRTVAVADGSAYGKILVEGNQAAAVVESAIGVIGLSVNAGARFDGGHVYALRPDLYFINTRPPTLDSILDRVRTVAEAAAPDLVTVTDITPGRTELLIAGPDSAALLHLLCGLDLHESHFPNLTAKQTSVAKTTNIVIRRDLGQLPGYWLVGARSYGAYMWDTIVTAGEHLEIAPIGLTALDALLADN